MFNIQNKLRKEATNTDDIRQRLLHKEFEDLKHLPIGCSVIVCRTYFPNF